MSGRWGDECHGAEREQKRAGSLGRLPALLQKGYLVIRDPFTVYGRRFTDDGLRAALAADDGDAEADDDQG